MAVTNWVSVVQPLVSNQWGKIPLNTEDVTRVNKTEVFKLVMVSDLSAGGHGNGSSRVN